MACWEARGKLMEDFIAQENLYVCNEPRNPPSFSGLRGESNIDVTLTTQGVMTLLKTWKVMSGWTSSEHNAILIEIKQERGESEIERRQILRFQTGKAN